MFTLSPPLGGGTSHSLTYKDTYLFGNLVQWVPPLRPSAIKTSLSVALEGKSGLSAIKWALSVALEGKSGLSATISAQFVALHLLWHISGGG